MRTLRQLQLDNFGLPCLFEWVHLTFADTSSRKLTIEISTAKSKDRGNTLDIPLRSR